MTTKLRTVSLFSGAGGLDAGLHATGAFDLLACVEHDARCCEALEANRDAGLFGSPSTEVIRADLSTLGAVALMERLNLAPGELDLLVGGPPCQAFSTAGNRRGCDDSRGLLVLDFLRLVAAMRPRFFLMENVRGMVSARGVLDEWTRTLAELDGYRADLFEVNAVNYGAPQQRERVLFIGNREGRVIEFPAPTHGPGREDRFATLRDALDGFTETDPVPVDFSPRKKRYLDLVPPGGNWRHLPDDVARESMGRAFHATGGRSGWWRRLSWDAPCPTVTTMPNHASTAMCHPDETRALTIGECARIQGFPDGWVFTGTAAQRMRQVGNAVPVRLGEVAGAVIANEARTPANPDPGALILRRVYLDSHVRVRSFWDGKQAVTSGATR